MRTAKSKTGENTFPSHEAKRQAIFKYSEYVLEGRSFKDIYQELNEEFGFDQNQCFNFYNAVKDTIAESVLENNERVVQIHLEIYEDIFQRFSKIDDSIGQMKAMKQKEELLKLYETETNEVIINQQTNIYNQVTYDVEKLDKKENSRLLELLQKAVE